MARMHVIASSSKGNGYVIEASREALILECGAKLMQVRKYSGVPITKVAGVLITHEHLDHAGYTREYLKAQLPTYATHGTAKAIEGREPRAVGIRPLEMLKVYTIGEGFGVRALPVAHDALEPCAFVIDHHETGRIAFFTDTYLIKYRVPRVRHLFIECNYIHERLNEGYQEGRIPRPRYERTLASHLSLEACASYIRAIDQSQLESITLIHLSSENSHETQMLETIQPLTLAKVCIAHPGLSFAL